VNKGFGISQKYAGSENWFGPHILWSREHELGRTGQLALFFRKRDKLKTVQAERGLTRGILQLGG
jgi:hypothetical protein